MTLDPVRMEEVPPLAIAAIRRVVGRSELSRVVPEGCGLVWNALKAQGIRGGRNVAIYWNGEILLEVGVECSAFAERDGLVRTSTPAGPVASVPHFGPYGALGTAHHAIQQWAREANRRLTGPNWEIYGHWEEAWNRDPSRIRTDVCYQVAPE